MKRVRDQLDRPLRDLRISLTDRCNFRCSYCMPREIFGADYAFLKSTEILTNEEILKVCISAKELGVQKIRLTGGEPLLRKDVEELIKEIRRKTQINDLSLTTNGVLLPKRAQSLKDAGLSRVNISLDSLNPETLNKISGTQIKPESILAGIDAAIDVGLGVKVNMVVKKAINAHEVREMASYFRGRGITLRFIEFMDVGNVNQWIKTEVLPSAAIISSISEDHELEAITPNYLGEVASRFSYKGTDTEIGLVSSISKPFCQDCNRMRLSADGQLFTCLFAAQGHDVKSVVRSGASQDQISEYIGALWSRRDDNFSETRQDSSSTTKNKKVEMSYIGG